MNNHKITVKVLLALVALSAAACLSSFAYTSYQDLTRQGRLERRAAFRLQEEEFRKLNAEHANWKNLPDALRKFRRRHVISMNGFARFRHDLNLCLHDNGFPAANITFKFGRSKGRLTRAYFQFALSGPYRSLKKFIYDMELKPKMQFFEKIDLSVNGEKVAGRFSMEAYLEP